MRPTKARQVEAGFTLLEMLIAIALFGIVVAVVLAPMTGFFGMTSRSNNQLDATGRAQAVLEQVQGQWQTLTQNPYPGSGGAWNPIAYDRTCVDTALALPAGITVTVQNFRADGTADTAPSGAARSSWAVAADCTTGTTRTTDGVAPYSTPANTVALKRVTVTAAVNTATANGVTSSLTLDIARPQ